MKTFGKVEFDTNAREWAISPEPHVMLRLKRVFERIPKHAHGTARLSDTPENARELQWFLERFPMVIADPARARLDNTAQQHQDRESTISKMLSVDYVPRAFELALPLRQYQQLAADLALASKQLLLADDVGLGKAQPDDEPVLTPGGWVPIDALRLGDEIIDPDGGWATVTGIYPQGERDVYEVRTSDGAITRCCDEHLWTIQTPADRRRGSTRTIPTSSLRALVRAKPRRKGRNRDSVFLPAHAAVDFRPLGKRLPVDPYVLGVLLGDGGISSGPINVIKADLDLHENVAAALPRDAMLVKTTEKNRWRIVGLDGSRNSTIRSALEKMGLLGCRAWEKFVPHDYLRSSVKQRWALLCGLMDTDGECDARSSHCVFTTTSPHLRDAVLELVRSLGGIAKACYRPKPTYRYKGKKKIGRPAWRIRINVPQCPFAIKRKSECWRKTHALRKVAAVRRVGKVSVRCIRVTSKRSLYFTSGYIPTHNTASMIGTLSDPSTRPALIVTLTHLPQQLAEEIDRFLPGLRIHILRGAQPYDVTDVWSGRKRKVRERAMPDVIITSYSRISGWADTLAPMIKGLYFDEVHELRHGGTNKYVAASHLREHASGCMGMSVGPQSHVLLRGGSFGDGWHGHIETAWGMMALEQSVTTFGDYEVVDLPIGIESRGWTGEGFAWKPVRKMLRHTCEKQTRVIHAGGRRLLVTDDHSVFVANKHGIVAVESSQINRGDILVVDDGAAHEVIDEKPIDVLRLVKDRRRAQVNVPLHSFSSQELAPSPKPKLWPQMWAKYRKSTSHGSRLPLELFQQHRHRFPVVGPVYLGGRGSPMSPVELYLSDMAYVLGFFIGDGWASKNRVCFAVELARVEQFVNVLRGLPFNLRIKIRKMKGASVEVRCSHEILARIIRSIPEIHQRCWLKRIPTSWITTWPEEKRRELVRGLVDSDGSVQSRSRGRVLASITTTSKQLAYDILPLLSSIGIRGGIHIRKKNGGGVVDGRRINAKRRTYVVSFNWNEFSKCTVGKRGERFKYKWMCQVARQAVVRATTPIDAPSHVYDFEMDGHPSFVADGLLVHNSATPINGYGGEIWYVMNIVAPGALGTRAEFLREHCGKEEITNEDDMAVLKASGGDKKARLSDPAAFGSYMTSAGLMLRRTRKEVGRELPPVQRIPYVIDCDPEELHEAQTTAAELAKIILSQGADPTSRFNASGRLDALIRQATGVAKAPYVAEFVRMLLEQGEKIVLFGWHKQVYDIWREKLGEFNPAWYTGDENTNEKQESKRRFCDGETNLLILSLRSGAGLDGLQYTGCRIVIFGELDWSEAQHEQAEGRVARDGQLESVACYYLLANAGSDPIIVDVLGLKRRQLEGIRNPNAPKIALKQTAADDRAKRLAAALLSKLDPDAYSKLTGGAASSTLTQTSADFTTIVEAHAHVDDSMLPERGARSPSPQPPSRLAPSPPNAPTAAPVKPTPTPTPSPAKPPSSPPARTTDPRRPGPVTRPAVPHQQPSPTKPTVATMPLPLRPPTPQRPVPIATPTQQQPKSATTPTINMGAWANRLGGVVRKR